MLKHFYVLQICKQNVCIYRGDTMETVLYGDLFIAGNSLVNITIFIFVGKFLRKHINSLFGFYNICERILFLMAQYINKFIFEGWVNKTTFIISVGCD